MPCALVVLPLPWCPPLFLHPSLGQTDSEPMACPVLSQGDAPDCHKAPPQHHHGPQSDSKKQVRALASMGCKCSPATRGKETNWMDVLEGIPCPGGTAAARSPAQAASPLQSPRLNGKRRCSATVLLFKERQGLNH